VATKTATRTAEPRTTAAAERTSARADEPTPDAPVEPEVEAEPVAAVATAPVARAAVVAPASSGQLPFTGDRTVELMIVLGGCFVLLGMAVQIAGEPLPARAHARRAARQR
jgi:hypothetical protein